MARSPKEFNDYTYSKEHALELIAQIKQWLGSKWKHNLFTNVPKDRNAWHFSVYRDGVTVRVWWNHAKDKLVGYQAQIDNTKDGRGGYGLWTPTFFDFEKDGVYKNPLLAINAAVARMDRVLRTLNDRAAEVHKVVDDIKKRLTK